MRTWQILLVLACSVARAHAQGAVTVTDLSGTYGTIGTAASLCVPAAPARATLFLFNSGSTNIGFGFQPSPSIGSAGTVELASGGAGWAFWGPGAAPKQPIYCVSSGAGGQLTILVGSE